MTRQSKSRRFETRDNDKRGRKSHKAQEITSPHIVFVGQNIDWAADGSGYTRPLVESIDATYTSVELQTDYDSKAFMGLDGLIRPVSMDGDGGFSPFVKYGDGNSLELDDMCYEITQDDLNPFTNPSGWERSHVSVNRTDTPTIGHDFEILGRGETPPPSGMIMPIAGYESEAGSDYTDDYRFLALRGPLVMQSWGYDIDGFPVPNKADTFENATNGVFVSDVDELECKFMDDFLKKPQSWPVAPVDLRLDRRRGVWTAFGGTSVISGSGVDTTGEGTDLIYIPTPRIKDPDLCLFSGVKRRFACSFSDENGAFCNATVSIDDVWVATICLDELPDCIVGEQICSDHETTTLGESGEEVTNSRAVYQFLTRSIGDPINTQPANLIHAAPSDCQCCCPTVGSDVHIEFLGDFCEGTVELQDGLMFFAEDMEMDYCVGGTWGPYTDIWYYDFTIVRPYPVLLVNVEMDEPENPDIIGYAKIDYNTGLFEKMYKDNIGGGPEDPDFVESTTYTITSVLGDCYILCDENGDIVTENMTFKYRMVWDCENDEINGGIDVAGPPAPTLFLLSPWHEEPTIVSDIQTISYDGCGVNLINFNTDTDFGDTCEISVDLPNGFSFDFNYFIYHALGMCDTVMPVSSTCGSGYLCGLLSPSYHDNAPTINFRIYW